MVDDQEPPPLARVFALWAGGDAARWRTLCGHIVHYPPRGDGTVRDIHVVDGTAYIHVSFALGWSSKFHADSVRANDVQLASLPPAIDVAEVIRIYRERWSEILRQREVDER